MSYNTNAKVNPFYIQEDEEDPWDDDYGDDEYGDEDYDDEQVMLIHGSAGIKNRKYNDPGAPRRNDARAEHQQQHPVIRRSFSYQDGRYEKHDRHLQHQPQLWKYGLLLLTIVGVVVFGSSSFSSKNDGNNVSLSSLVDEMETPNNDDYQIVVLGERHSGTAWMRDRLGECFPHAHVSNHLQRMGYFFQDDEETAVSKEETLGKHNHKSKGIIVVHVTLNVYDWLEQMRLSPEYAPDHAGKHEELGHPVPLGWEEFLSKPWTTERPESDLNLVNETGPVCQMGFRYNEVVSCSKTEGGIGDPMYELKPGGVEESHPFESVIDLRTAKLQNHHSVLDSWPSVKKRIHVSYETTAQDFKTKLLEEILEFTGWNGGSYTHPNGASPLPCSGNVLPPSLDSSKEMTTEFINYVNDHADWETELKVASYEPWTDDEIAAKGIRPEPSVDGSVEEVEDRSKADADVDVDSNDDSETPQTENEATARSDPSPTPPVNESSESTTDAKSKDESKEIKENDDKTESSSSSSTSSQNEEGGSDVTTDNSQSTSGTEKVFSSSSSNSEQETTEETVEEETPPPPPPATKDPSSETKSESPKPTEEEASAHTDESSNQDEDSKERDELSKESSESAESAFDEKEEEKLPVASSSDQDEESDTISSALNTVEVASSEEGSNADAASKPDSANEENSNGEEASPSDDKETTTVESKENTQSGEETPESTSNEKEEETSVENVEAPGNENETEGDGKKQNDEQEKETNGDAESAGQDENEIETEALDSNLEEDNGTHGAESDKNNNDDRQ